MKTVDSLENTKYLNDLSLRLVRLSGNERIRKRIRSAGGGDAFNVLDEIPQLALDHLLSGRSFELLPFPDVEKFLDDEKTEAFEKAYRELREREGREFDSLDEEEDRAFRDRVRKILSLPPLEEILPNHSIDLPRANENSSENEKRHVDRFLQTDIIKCTFHKTLDRIEKRRLVYEREKGLITFFLAVGFLEWTKVKPNSEDFYEFNSPILLLPLTLEYQGTKAKLKQSGGDLRLNEDLFHALKESSGTPPPLLPMEENEELAAFNLDTYLDEFEAYTKKHGLKEWKLRRRMVVGIFRSTGIPPSELIPERFENEAIDRMASWVIGEDGTQERLDAREVDSEEYGELAPAFALPADSSQHSAVLDVATGMSLVVEGPPGTGKSQTIVNLIANAIDKGKKVLFLAQKTAALEVVRQRLENIGLGNKCLAIHSGYASKSVMFEEVGRRIAVEPPSKSHRKGFERKRKRRDERISKLNRYSELLRRRLGAEEASSENDDLFTAYEAVTNHSTMSDTPDHLEDPLTLPPRLTKTLLDDARKACDSITEVADRLGREIPARLSFIRRSRPFSPFDLDEFEVLARKGLSTLEPLGEEYADKDLSSLETEIERIKAFQDLRSRLDEIESKLEEEYRNLEEMNSKSVGEIVAVMWRANAVTAFLWPSFRRAKAAMLHLVRKTNPGFDELREMGDALQKILKESDELKKDLRKEQMDHLSSKDFAEQMESLSDQLRRIKEVAESLREQDCILEEPIKVRDLREKLQTLIDHKSSLPDLCIFNGRLAELDSTFGCDQFVRSALTLGHPLADVFAKRFLRELCRDLCRKEPDFLEFSGDEIEKLRKELGQMEGDLRSEYCKVLGKMAPDPKTVHSVNARRVGEKEGLALLRHVGAKTKARITVRELMHREGTALNEYCPCFLMTPSSVADFLPPDHSFDLLLIDEASQMLVEEAAGSMLRSKQIVVVGDRQQMPPTRYMVSTLDVAEDEDRDESILERASLALPAKRRLLYHYRSEDENLIAFSNHEFYDGELLSIPNLREDKTLGVNLERANGTYESGKDGCSRDPNPIEAERAVQLILEHIREFPDRSLGVAVLNLRQATRIEEIFFELADKDLAVTEFLNQWQSTPEYFFIKNLDNVQGDERDVILIATVFGKNGEGKVHQRFGPISQPMGENRINVLITRAKKRVIVCTSLEPNDLTLNKEGPQVLSRYLSYAATGNLPGGARLESGHFAAPCEKWFHDRLEADGYKVDPQVGVSGWKVNLGVKHPDNAHEYLCGIELDGPNYHLAPGARDRDVGRPFILRAKGWNVIQVWSIDFFHDPEAEYARVVRVIESLKEKTDPRPEPSNNS